ncbi:glycosyl transferase [Betaproteobacteria bacterium]|nr:glycosyl transferase [Betaproteobacteria bacterium]
MRILVLTKYECLGASSRVRFLQYIPYLKSTGMDVFVAPFLSNEYIISLQSGARKLSDVFGAYARRIHTIIMRRNFDLMWIEKEVFPWLPAWFECLLLLNKIPYVLDYDDAVFHNYDMSRNILVRAALAKKHDVIMNRAAAVVVGNQYLMERAEKCGAAKIELIPTVVDLDKYQRIPISVGDKKLPCVIWVGQRSTAKYLEPLADMMRSLSESGICRFVAMGVDTNALGLPMDSVQWSEESEAKTIAEFDIGIMPLPDNPFERGKCGYKLIQYMACNLPVVASPVGVNRVIVQNHENGFLASTIDEWESSIRKLCADSDLRSSLGAQGRALVEKEYCLSVVVTKLVKLLSSLVRNR